jgi:serine protease AprX
MIVSLLMGTLPAGAKEDGERQGNVRIEAKKELAIDTATSRNGTAELVIIQFDGPVEAEWKEEVEERGVTLGDYIPDYAYIAKLESSRDKRKIEKLSFVQKVVPFQPVSKVAPTLRSVLGKKKNVEVAVIGFDRNVDMRRTVTRAAVRGGVEDIRGVEDVQHISLAKLSGQSLEQVIESDEVIAVVPMPENKLHNDIAATIVHADELAFTGYTGKGQIVGIADTGLDTGDESTIHTDFRGQINSLYAIGREGDASDLHGHGTHVAGTLLGTGEASGGKLKGMATDAKLVFHSIEDEDGRLNTDIETILSESYEDGARIHSDSWGADDEGEYSLSSFLFDQFLWEHPDMTALVAAGNVGDSGYQTVGSPATAKNVIAVGATENDRPDLGSGSNNPDSVWKYSSRGLTADGRLKPDIVAPGTSILSTRSSFAPSKNFDQNYNSHYAYMSGTSMATPVLAGGVAQIRQFLQEQGVKKPSGALIKSMLLTGADDLQEDMRSQGFGRANLERTIKTSYKDEEEGIQTKEKVVYGVKVSDDSKPLAITLAWTDYPSSLVAERNLVNDLNLTVKTPSGKKLNGNDFFEAPYDDEVDNLNNVEQIWIQNPEEGIYTVTVEGYNIPEGPQPFAIASTGEWSRIDQKEDKRRESRKKTTLTTKRSYMEYTIRSSKPGELQLSANWEQDADVNLYVYDSKKKKLASAAAKDKPETLTVNLRKSGLYKIRVELKDGDKAEVKLQISYPK